MSSNETSYGAKAFAVGLISTILCILIACFVAPYSIDWDAVRAEQQNGNSTSSNAGASKEKDKTFKVVSVVDGDTIRVDYDGKEELVRLIGINTPEVDGPYTEKECYGDEASVFAKEKLTGQWVTLEADSSQSDRDKYDRLLRYVSLDGEDFGKLSISRGYAYEFTYNNPYSKQGEYRTAQDDAKRSKRGLWGGCPNSSGSNKETEEQAIVHIYGEDGDCNIKGNISYKTGERIYHMPGQEHYAETRISPEYGERWFCSEEEAIVAGWRKSKDAYISNDGSGTVIDIDDSRPSGGVNNDGDYSGKSSEVSDNSYEAAENDSYSKSENEASSKKKSRNVFEWLVFIVIFLIEIGCCIPLLAGVFIGLLEKQLFATLFFVGLVLPLIIWMVLQVKVFLYL